MLIIIKYICIELILLIYILTALKKYKQIFYLTAFIILVLKETVIKSVE